MFEKEKKILDSKIKKILEERNLPNTDLKWSSIPFSGHWGLSTSFFNLHAEEAKIKEGINIRESAAGTASYVEARIGEIPGFYNFESINGYLNCYFDPTHYSERILNQILTEKDNYGSGDSTQTVMVEFSQPNTHKAFHVGHLRNMVLGDAVCRMLEFAGNDVIRANYIGDIGLHVIKWLWNYMKFHPGETPPEEGITRWMGDLYAESIRHLEENAELDAEVRDLFRRWDEKEPAIVELWERTRQWSLDAFTEVYELLDIRFDKVYLESEVEDSGKQIVEQLIKAGIAKDERPEGAVIVDLDEVLGTENKHRVLVILRSDGTSLYSTKDLSLAIKKFEEYPLDQSVYVIDVRQSLYMQQIFKTLELLGYEWAKSCYHLAYEIVNLPGNVTIASREGTVVLLEDLIAEAEKRARSIVEEKNPELEENAKGEIARKVALGALKYSLLSRDNTKVITFDWESAMDVNGQAAPYIQYAFVRANSILRKVHFSIPENVESGYTLSEAEIELIDTLSRFPQEVEKSAKEMRPLLIANYAYDLAKAFSNFYNQCPVLTAEAQIRDFRLALTAASKQVIQNSLSLLGIQIPEVM
jgi:arginyl-tRNA synthetase